MIPFMAILSAGSAFKSIAGGIGAFLWKYRSVVALCLIVGGSIYIYHDMKSDIKELTEQNFTLKADRDKFKEAFNTERTTKLIQIEELQKEHKAALERRSHTNSIILDAEKSNEEVCPLPNFMRDAFERM